MFSKRYKAMLFVFTTLIIHIVLKRCVMSVIPTHIGCLSLIKVRLG